MDIKFYSLEEVAEMLDVDYQLIYKQVKSGNMPSIRIGKLYRISTLQFQEYLNRQSTGIPATGTSEHACSLCGKKYFSELSISGACRDCGAPLCRACVENDKAELCEIHKK